MNKMRERERERERKLCMYLVRGKKKKRRDTRSAEPGFMVNGVFNLKGQKINPFGSVDVLINAVLDKSGVYSLPIDFCWFHRERERGENEKGLGGQRGRSRLVGRQRGSERW